MAAVGWVMGCGGERRRVLLSFTLRVGCDSRLGRMRASGELSRTRPDKRGCAGRSGQALRRLCLLIKTFRRTSLLPSRLGAVKPANLTPTPDCAKSDRLRVD